MHPPLYPFLDRNHWISFGIGCLKWNSEERANAEELIANKLLPITRGPEIATFLGVSPRTITRATKVPIKYYRLFRIKKKSGGVREIAAPRVYLKSVQRYILDCILARRRLSESVVGFVRGKRLSTGAKVHVGARYVWNIDIEKFFPNVSATMVFNVFGEMGYRPTAAKLLTRLCCLSGSLPQGAPTSPMLANLAFSKSDESILALTQPAGIAYTRYADDLTFSSPDPIPSSIQKAVVELIRANGFPINKAKTRLMGPACRREITGLVVNTRLSVPRQYRRRLRAIVHRAVNGGPAVDRSPAQIRGMIEYVGAFHPEEATRYKQQMGF